MSNFWAKFKIEDSKLYRFDTRIYLNKIDNPENNDVCIGAVVGKNPGSAKPTRIENNSLQKINLDGDKLLPTVRNIIQKSYRKNDQGLPTGHYVQVLNLFYLCNSDLKEAINKFENNDKKEYCSSENKHFPWIWYLWGGSNTSLNNYKKRFKDIQANTHFFFNQKTKKVCRRVPASNDFARHTQGLKQNLIIPFISEIVKFT